ncbi:hypothetical protein [Streptomyces sp. NPDC058657]|uniref:hypothetical protein n=1 Tax=unclassified Streptomyces TaxID=2593676 RepID=UPI00364A3B51
MSLTLGELTERMDRADERGLAVSALACLDRCLPLLEYVGGSRPAGAGGSAGADGAAWSGGSGGADGLPRADGLSGVDTEAALRPLWEAAEGGEAWLGRLREAAAGVVTAVGETDFGPAGALRRAADVPQVYEAGELRRWARECSAAALAVHRHLDGGREDGPLATGELRRQERLLGLLTGEGDGLRAVLVQSDEGKRVLRAAAARRARRG